MWDVTFYIIVYSLTLLFAPGGGTGEPPRLCERSDALAWFFRWAGRPASDGVIVGVEVAQDMGRL